MMTRMQIYHVLLAGMFALSKATYGHAESQITHKEIIFKQPILHGIDDNFHVPLAEHRYPDERWFNLILWQPNPTRADGRLVPSSWSAGDKTGFYPKPPLEQHQASFQDSAGESTVQIEGDTVAAYITSSDLPGGSPGNKMMITPEFRLPPSRHLFPFKREGGAIVTSLELQVPVAEDLNRPGNYTYVEPYLVFMDPNAKVLISYGIVLFHNAPMGRTSIPNQDTLHRTEVGPYDERSHSYQVGNPLAPDSRVVSALPGSTLFQTHPWKGWRPFQFAILKRNFEVALKSLKDKDPTFVGSTDPADYELIRWHLNAEIQFATSAARLGWSLRNAEIDITPVNDLTVLH
jgi:hypothetical protein